MNKIVGIGEYIISNQDEDKIITYALASCVAVTVYCPLKKVAGMIHIALPEPMDNVNNSPKPGYYAIIGLPFFLQTIQNTYMCNKENLHIQLFGGANSIRKNDAFSVGKKNIEIIERILTEKGFSYELQSVGGYVSRSIELEVETGQVKIDLHPIQI